ncbi:MAG: chemotaxis protein CheA [Helicobacteraceae bacterium]|jgi:two-component system chemotaxis sensor kinase CheA|nr:chemotaxis protein CheA [Helicobacteraceae bacterium]
MDKERLKGIFIEEASEIIEKLDSEILNFEESPTDRAILNELFRGVHTLKGSANSFGFTRLGTFVHKFEDALDYFRSNDAEITHETIDLFLESVDLVKAVMEYETDGKEGEPENYQKCLNGIRALMEGKDGKETPQKAAESQKDLAGEFGNDTELIPQPTGDNTYIITLKTDRDIYFRGYDHATFFKLIAECGTIKESTWNISAISTLDKFSINECAIGKVTIKLTSKEPIEKITEIFEFLEPNEYEIAIEKPIGTPPEEPIKTVEAAKNAIKESKKEKENKDTKKNETAKSFVKIDSAKLDELFDSIGELVIAQNFMSENTKIRELQDQGLDKTIETLSKITRLIQNRVMSLRMVPIKDTFEKMRRVVRDASKKVDKEIKLIISGEETEIDKTMVDRLSDPLIHMIRNSIDHGIEATVEDRRKRGKEAEGIITLRAFHKGGNIAIEVGDDGRGINRDAVLKKAIERNLAKPDDELSDSQVFGFIMQAGFSTAEKLSDISGRGVGLDVVRSSIESMHGKIEIESGEGKGSTFRILLPLTLAIIDGMLVRSGNEIFIIPTLSIVESLRPSQEIVHTAQEKGEFVNLRSELLPVVRLNRKLNINEEMPLIYESTLVCAENERGRFAILVDELLGRQQVVIKPLGNALSHLREVSGGAVMGNGEIALIINVEGLY